MSSFIFFVVLTMVMAFVMNWVFMQYFYICTDCTHTSKHTANTTKLEEQVGSTTECEDMDAFLH
jgi:hypothetical protein